jgi:hypothetical protein
VTIAFLLRHYPIVVISKAGKTMQDLRQGPGYDLGVDLGYYASVAAISVAWFFSFKFRPFMKRKKAPPGAYPNMNFFQFIKHALGPNGPEYVYQLCQEVGYIFQVPGTKVSFHHSERM